MGAWLVEFLPQAESDLARIDRVAKKRIIGKLGWLAKNFDEIIPLGLGGEFKEFYKLRIGDWRLIYQVDWKGSGIVVCYIDRRDTVYKKR
jgi:mRNA interferase RelE/StbE